MHATPDIRTLTPQQLQRVKTRLQAEFDQATIALATNQNLSAFITVDNGSAVIIEELQSALRSQLPSYMLPKSISVLPALPSTANGKTDKAALRKLSAASNRAAATDPSPAKSSDPLTNVLVSIWRRVLALDELQLTDDFFQLGGDSILAIQVVSEMRKHGYQTSVSQLFENPTIETLRASLSQASNPRRAQPQLPDRANATRSASRSRSDLIPFTPIQSWFFERDLVNPDHWNQSFLLELDSSVTYAMVKRSFSRLFERRDALRLKVEKRPTSRIQVIEAFQDFQPSIDCRRIHPLEEEREQAIIEQAANILHSTLRLNEGKLLRASYFSFDGRRRAKLLIVAHHLCVDAVSWITIFEELRTSLRSDENDAPAANREPSQEFANRSRSLHDFSNSDACAKSIEFWKRQSFKKCGRIPFDYADVSNNTEGSARLLRFELNPTDTAAVIRKATDRKSSIMPFTLAALNLSLRDWLNTTKILIGVEGHGREEIDSTAISSNVVGWLTSYFPFSIDLQFAETPLHTLNEVDRHLKEISENGMTFGLLKYCNEDSSVSAFLSRIPEPEVTFNFLGKHIPKTAREDAFQILDYRIGVDRDPRNRRTCVFEIDATIIDDSLCIDWIYSDKLHRLGTIEALGQSLIAHLKSFAKPDLPHVFPLNSAQQSLLLHRRSHPDADQGELLLSGDLKGEVSSAEIEAAWNRIVARHPALRSTIEWEGRSEPALIVSSASPQALEARDLSDATEQEQHVQLQRLRDEQRRAPTSIDASPNNRLLIVKRSPVCHTFLWRCHHIFLDGWSSSIILNELLADLNLEPPVDTGDAEQAFYQYYAWLRTLAPSPIIGFWNNYLRGISPGLILPQNDLDRAPSGLRATGRGVLTETLSPNDATRLQNQAARMRASPSAILIASWSLVVASLTNKNSVCFGLGQSGRSLPFDNAGDIVGNLANVVPFRTEISADNPLESWLHALLLNQEATARYAHAFVPHVNATSDDPDPGVLFDSTLAIANYPQVDPSCGVRLENFIGDTTSAYPLSLTVGFGSELTVMIDYDQRLQSEDCARFILSAFVASIKSLCSASSTTSCLKLDPEVLNTFLRLRKNSENPQPKPSTIDSTSIAASEPTGEIEKKLLAILRDLLADPSIGPKDDFFAIGGTSIQAVQLFNRIERNFGIRLPVSLLFEKSSVAALAQRLIPSHVNQQRFQSLVQIRSGAAMPALFLIHAGGLELLFYKSLVERLDSRLPVYGLQAIGLDNKSKPLDDLAAIATRYREEMQSVQPNGPYFIIGHCFGATIAFEIARQLRDRNFDVPMLISLDGPAPRLKTAFDKPFTRSSRPFVTRVIGRIKREVSRFQNAIRFRLVSPPKRREMTVKRVSAAYSRAARSQSTSRYLGPALHFKCANSENFLNHTDLAWAIGAPNTEIVYLDCLHDEILKEPHVATVADAITRALNDGYFESQLTSATPRS